ncbi:coiled-coil domain-containing protein 40-like [Convolutriloba macropyga]|uniref:coiled-coil domain-containing protein 40-like n=1 Tax=Convolutriloba macropyga TaxID=536237 RepID=UPI003F51F91C
MSNNENDDNADLDQVNDDFEAETAGDLPNDDFGDDDYLNDVDDDANDDEDVDEGAVGGDGGESDGESEMVVLDPDHPLMARFQAALKKQLSKQQEKVTLEYRELDEALRNRKKEREDIGIQLYNLQQELARQQMALEAKHDQFNKAHQEKLQVEVALKDAQDNYRETQKNLHLQQKKSGDLQQELDKLSIKLFYLNKNKDDVRGDIAVMKRAAEKAEKDAGELETEKQKQDLFVDRLVETLDKLREQVALYEAQYQAQVEETKAAKEALTDAQTEIESINLEKKQLYQQWNSSLIGMRRRDEAHAALVEAIEQQKQRLLTLDQEIEAYKKSIAKSQEENEKLTLISNQRDTELATIKKQLQIAQNKFEALKHQFATYQRTLQETEAQLDKAQNEQKMKQNEIEVLRKNIEKENQEKLKIEDQIEETLRSQLTMEKAKQYTKKLTNKLKEKAHEMANQVSNIENETARDTLTMTNLAGRLKRLEQTVSDLNSEIAKKHEIAEKSESEIYKRNAVIERKQGQIDQLNKKIDQLKAERGGEEISPQEFEIKSLNKAINLKNQEITEMQQFWLKEQTELVKLSQARDLQTQNVDLLKKQLLVLEQRKLRKENEISGEEKEIGDLERRILQLQKDMVKLNVLVNDNKKTEYDLEKENELANKEFRATLQDLMSQSQEMQNTVDAQQEEKERLLNSLVEAERQIMLWEKKTQILRETRAAVDSEAGQGEIKQMKSEIHRMEVRFAQLLRQQENMIQDMEKAVSRRDTIVTRGEALQKMKRPVVTEGQMQKQLIETKKKIKQSLQDADNAEAEINKLRSEQVELQSVLSDKRRSLESMQEQSSELDAEYEKLLEDRQRNMADLLALQQKSKNFEALKNGKYVMLCKTEAGLNAETQKQTDKFHKLTSIVDRLNNEHPHLQPSLRKVTLSLGSRGLQED